MSVLPHRFCGRLIAMDGECWKDFAIRQLTCPDAD
jgi:hypothetical protein